MSTAVTHSDHQEASAEQQDALHQLIVARFDGAPRLIKAAEHAVVCAHLSFAGALARRYRGRGVELEDLRQLARLGLVKAVKRWQPAVGAEFLPFAYPTILGEIKRYFRDSSNTIRIPRSVHGMRTEVEVLGRELEQRLGRAASDVELAEAVGVGVEQIQANSAASAGKVLSLNVESVHHAAAQRVSLDAEFEIELTEDRIIVRQAMARLTDREREILRLRYFEGMSQKLIGERMGVSQMQISRIMRSVILKLSDQISSDNRDLLAG